jgi:hypothetical protein
MRRPHAADHDRSGCRRTSSGSAEDFAIQILRLRSQALRGTNALGRQRAWDRLVLRGSWGVGPRCVGPTAHGNADRVAAVTAGTRCYGLSKCPLTSGCPRPGRSPPPRRLSVGRPLRPGAPPRHTHSLKPDATSSKANDIDRNRQDYAEILRPCFMGHKVQPHAAPRERT